jgi:copper chaperone CopZ
MERYVFAIVLAVGLSGFGGIIYWHQTSGSRVHSSAVTQGLASVELDVEKMSCRGCRASVKSTLERMGGVQTFTLDRKGATVAYEPERIGPGEIASRVFSKTGFRASVRGLPRAFADDDGG